MYKTHYKITLMRNNNSLETLSISKILVIRMYGKLFKIKILKILKNIIIIINNRPDPPSKPKL